MARLKNQYEFMAGMYIEGELYFNRYAMTIDFYTLDGAPEDHNIAVDRMSYFIYDAVQRSMFIHEAEFDQINLLTKAGIPVLTVPDPGPFDPVVLAILVTKMNAMLEGILVITEAELVSEVAGPLIYVWDAADEEDEIHSIVNDSDIVKWWASPAPRFGSYPDGVDVAEVEAKSPFPLSWQDLKLGWYDEYNEADLDLVVDSVTKGKKQSTVIKADFTDPKKK